jgi:hypothetical protein
VKHDNLQHSFLVSPDFAPVVIEAGGAGDAAQLGAMRDGAADREGRGEGRDTAIAHPGSAGELEGVDDHQDAV